MLDERQATPQHIADFFANPMYNVLRQTISERKKTSIVALIKEEEYGALKHAQGRTQELLEIEGWLDLIAKEAQTSNDS